VFAPAGKQVELHVHCKSGNSRSKENMIPMLQRNGVTFPSRCNMSYGITGTTAAPRQWCKPVLPFAVTQQTLCPTCSWGSSPSLSCCGYSGQVSHYQLRKTFLLIALLYWQNLKWETSI